MNPEVATALVGVALLSVLLFPTIAGVLLGRARVSNAGTRRESREATP